MKSTKMERTKSVSNVRWGGMCARGKDMYRLKSKGKKTVRAGIDKSRFDGWGFNRIKMSLVLSITAKQVRKKIHSNETFMTPVSSIPPPYQVVVNGQNNCTPCPVR